MKDLVKAGEPVPGFRRCEMRDHGVRGSIIHYIRPDLTQLFMVVFPGNLHVSVNVLPEPRPWAASNFETDHEPHYEFLDPVELWHQPEPEIDL